MAKPDWGALQHQFLAEHAKSGISPKDWCEAQGLNYATARRYIKKPSAQKLRSDKCAKLRNARCHRLLWLKKQYLQMARLRRKRGHP